MIPIEVWVTVAAVLIAQGAVFFRWLYRKMRDDDINRAFVRDMATNHLPHVYGALRQIAGGQGIELADPPPIHWIDLNGRNKR